MRATAEKSTTTTPATVHQARHQSFFQRADARPGGLSNAGVAVQAKLTVNTPGDSFEQEADRMADHVMRAPAVDFTTWAGGRASDWVAASGDRLQRAAVPLQRKETAGVPTIDAATQATLISRMSGGEPLAPDVRRFMEPRFGVDFSGVRVHRDRESAGLSNRLSARAFTFRNHIFFSDNQYQPGTQEGQHLLAHELTHTVQQGQAVHRSPQISTTHAAPSIQRLGVQDALDYFADKAYYIPGFRLLCILLGFNPINQRSAERSAANILLALVELIPGGALIAQTLDNHGVFARAGTWVEQQLATLGDIGSDVVAGLARFMDSLSWTDIIHLGSVWERAKAIFTNPIGRLIGFGVDVVSDLLAMVREVVLLPLARLAEGTAGYDLLKALLGQDPITGNPVPRSPAILIGGFMKLIGQEEVWENIQNGHAIGRAWAWFQGALTGLLDVARAIPAQIVETLRSITWQDVLSITGLFSKVGRAFLNMAGQFFSWAGAQVITLLEIIFTVVAPRAVPYVRKAQGTFRTIIQNPVGFVGNLVRAGRLGFQNFAAHIGEHLKTALIKWIVGPLGDAGVYIPKEFSLIEVVKLVLSVLGLTWTHVRSKLVRIIPDPVLTVLETTASVLVTLVRDGPVAAWNEIRNELNELKDSLIAKVTEMVTSEIVNAAVTKLVSLLNPAGAVIQAILAIYNTITFFIEKINQIAAVVASFIDSIAAIAAGQVDTAASKVEQTMANTLTVIIAFLARFVGLGGVPNLLVGIVMKIRAPIDKGLDKIVVWLGNLLDRGRARAAAIFEWWRARVGFRNAAGESHSLSFRGSEDSAKLTVESTPIPLESYLADYEIQNSPNDAQKAIIRTIRGKATRIEEVKSRMGTRNRSSFGRRDGESIQALFNDIAVLLRGLGGNPTPPTRISWSDPNEDGVSMRAEILSIDPGGFSGSQPTQESNLWRRIKRAYPNKYVRGHLLNHHVHGPGNKKNMTPITRDANGEMERVGESVVKRMVLSEKKVLSYAVTVTAVHTDVPQEFNGLARGISLHADELEFQNNQWTVGKANVVSVSIVSPFPPP